MVRTRRDLAKVSGNLGARTVCLWAPGAAQHTSRDPGEGRQHQESGPLAPRRDEPGTLFPALGGALETPTGWPRSRENVCEGRVMFHVKRGAVVLGRAAVHWHRATGGRISTGRRAAPETEPRRGRGWPEAARELGRPRGATDRRRVESSRAGPRAGSKGDRGVCVKRARSPETPGRQGRPSLLPAHSQPGPAR